MAKDSYKDRSFRHDWNFRHAFDRQFSTATGLRPSARHGNDSAFNDADFYVAVQSRKFAVPTDDFPVPAKAFRCFDSSGNLAASD
jgi:hypothetical protein